MRGGLVLREQHPHRAARRGQRHGRGRATPPGPGSRARRRRPRPGGPRAPRRAPARWHVRPPRRAHGRPQERRALAQRLDQRHPQIRPEQREGEPGRAGAGAHVDDAGAAAARAAASTSASASMRSTSSSSRARRGEVDARVPLLRAARATSRSPRATAGVERRAPSAAARPVDGATPSVLPVLAVIGRQWYLSSPPSRPMSARRPVPPAPAARPRARLRAPRGARRARVPGRRRRSTCEPMPGGASTRRYFRVAVAGGTRRRACSSPTAPSPRRSPRRGRAAPAGPSSRCAICSRRAGSTCPRVHGEDTARGWVLLEDLGDDTLAGFLVGPPRPARGALRPRRDRSRRAPRRRSRRCPPGASSPRAPSTRSCCAGRSTTSASGRSRRAASRSRAADRARLRRASPAASPRRIAELAARLRPPRLPVAQPHGRAPRREAVCWIDFQDALLGPRIYDLVALLNDSYQVFDRALRRGAPRRLRARARASTPRSAPQLGREFDLVTVQRKLKDAGRFVFIDRVKKNPVVPQVRRADDRQGARQPRAALPTTRTCARSSALLARALPLSPCRAAASPRAALLGARAAAVGRARAPAPARARPRRRRGPAALGGRDALLAPPAERLARRASRRCARWACASSTSTSPGACTRRRPASSTSASATRASTSRTSSSSRTSSACAACCGRARTSTPSSRSSACPSASSGTASARRARPAGTR